MDDATRVLVWNPLGQPTLSLLVEGPRCTVHGAVAWSVPDGPGSIVPELVGTVRHATNPEV